MIEETIDKTYFVDSVLVEIIKDIEQGVPQEPVNIILTVGGHLISGQIVSAKDWADEQFRPPNADENEPAPEQKKQEETSNDEKRFIHLKNAKIFHGNVQIPYGAEGFYWRGKLIAVDGYMLQNIKLVEKE